MSRKNREWNELRPVTITPDVNIWAEGSVEIKIGNTILVCTASVSETTPKWLNRPNRGWVTAEYGMLPRCADSRMSRERAFSSGRSQEISRLIGRSLRAGVDLDRLGERQIQVDCDVLQADGGTRTAGVTGGFVALALALNKLKQKSLIEELPLTKYVSACSVGFTNGNLLLDLNSKEDKTCGMDTNFVLSDNDEFIEIQGTAETEACSQNEVIEMMNLAKEGARVLFQKQAEILSGFFKCKI